ncbi:MAG: hydrogenase expression/formation protein HypE [bacterium]|nr:hydrogenase expression/formation protein HypE [bacterium]
MSHENIHEDTVQLAHGSGGSMSRDLVSQVFLRAFGNASLNRLDDHALVEAGSNRLAFSTDSYVVDPLFFSGGDIGDLAVNGTVNDLCTGGGRPICLSAGFIVEEGLPIADLKRVASSMSKAAKRAGVPIVTGDTKVVDRGKGDKLFINTSGIAVVEHNFEIHGGNLQPGDKVLISGTIADHGISILALREGLSFETSVQSDTAALNGLVADILEAGGGSVHAMRDPTRGGVGAVLNELAESSGAAIALREECLPIAPPVRGACEILGLDPLYIANEGKMIVSVAADRAEAVLRAMRSHELGDQAAEIGEVTADCPGLVSLLTALGTRRIVDMPVGLQLPRIC